MVIPDNTSRPLPALLERRVPGDCRAEVRGILQEVYGYDDFRDLEIYDNLFEGKDKICLSQGRLIEHVIREAESAHAGRAEVGNMAC